MPAAHPPEFRRRAVELARERSKPIKQLARDIGISESCLRTWMTQADIDEGKRKIWSNPTLSSVRRINADGDRSTIWTRCG